MPAVIDALRRLEIEPDVILVNGQGLAHPRRFGLACHLGFVKEVSTIGFAKSRLMGRYELLGADRGSSSMLKDKGDAVRRVVCTRADVSPFYPSVGHKVDIESAVAIVLKCFRKYRLSETTRFAHQAAAGRYSEGL